ncbi:MAG: polyprenyl synthetase family protein [Kiritimatiellae bacterium]|nr:polyprenyl synthetase family protein [Kiritimatiellia bacterium]
MTLEEICSPVRNDLLAVEARLRGLPASQNEIVARAVAGILAAGGKRLRPALVLMAARACAYTGKKAVSLATTVELIHTASLIHDDIIDNADLRRGVPTVNASLGNRVSVLAGDYIYSTVFSLLAEEADPHVMRAFAAAARDMTDSEMTQTLSRHDADLSEEKYLSIISGKTATLLECSCQIGAMLGRVRNGEVDILGQYGRNLGMAFQITDDLLDVVGQPNRLGKPVGNDVREGRLTLPFIHAIRVAPDADREWMRGAFTSGPVSDDTIARLRRMAERYGGIEYSRRKAEAYGRACTERLGAIADSDVCTSLRGLVNYVMQRAC